MQKLLAESEPATPALPGQVPVVHGSEDKSCDCDLTIKQVNRMLARGDNVGLAYIPGVDHFGGVRSPEALAAMKEFRKGCLLTPLQLTTLKRLPLLRLPYMTISRGLMKKTAHVCVDPKSGEETANAID